MSDIQIKKAVDANTLVTNKKVLFKRIIVCSLIVFLALVAITPNKGVILQNVKAGNAAYSMTEYQCTALSTIDGAWTTAGEWNDGPRITMSDNASFTYKVDMTSFSMQWLIEDFADSTNNTGDYWQICLDQQNSGGATPQSGDFKIEIQGHTTLKLYQGNGTGWTEVSPQAGELTWANTISSSPWDSSPHWILELSDSSKIAGTLQTPQPPNGMRVAAYDAATGELASWAPNSSADVPSQWGVISDYSLEPLSAYSTEPTAAPIITATPTPTLIAIPTPIHSAIPTATPTQTPSPSATPTPPAEWQPAKEELTPKTPVNSIMSLQDTGLVLLFICVETIIFAIFVKRRSLKKK